MGPDVDGGARRRDCPETMAVRRAVRPGTVNVETSAGGVGDDGGLGIFPQ